MASEACPYCLADVRVTWWHHLFGLSTQCPNCGAYSGPPWTINRLIAAVAASLLVNALVLFAMTRPLRAVILIAVYAATVAALIAGSGTSDGLLFTAVVAMLLGPACLAALEYYWHAVELEQGPLRYVSAAPEASEGETGENEFAEPQLMGTTELERIRNELEIAIYHEKDRLGTVAKCAYALSALAVFMAVLEKQWLEIAVPAVLAGLAYTAEEHESRAFAAAYTMAGALLAVQFARDRLLDVPEPHGISLAIGVLILGFTMTRTTITLARLRWARSTIPLEPAEHLRD